MKARHTPGPWEVHGRQPTFVRANGGKKHVANTDSMGDDEENKANARLIAAAPELLESLREILDGGIADPAAVRRAHAAIANATGAAL